MPFRGGLGPVFAVETLLNARRPTIYAGRSLFVLVLLAGLTLVWIGITHDPRTGTASGSLKGLARAGESFYYTLTLLELAVALLAAPAATAGAICLDRSRGGLTHLLVTDLSDAEIVLGKLAARLAPIVGLLACTLPVTAMATLLGGIDAGALNWAFVVCLAVAVLGCSLAMTISVWATRPHEVMMAVFACWVAAFFAETIWKASSTQFPGLPPPPAWFGKLDPSGLIFAPYRQPGVITAADYVIFTVVALAVSAFLNAVTIACLRRSMATQSGRSRRPSRLRLRGLLPGPSLDGNPVLWLQWHHSRPSRLGRIVWTAFALVSVLATIWGIHEMVTGTGGIAQNALLAVGMLQVFVGLLMASAAAPTALSEERGRGSLDLVMSTPLSTRAIVLGKWLGAFRIIPWLALLPLIAAVTIAVLVPQRTLGTVPAITILDRVMVPVMMAGLILAAGAVITSLGLALAIWIPRVGRAVGFSVSAYLVLSVGWPILCQILLKRIVFGGRLGSAGLPVGLLGLSPVVGSALILQGLFILRGLDAPWLLWLTEGSASLSYWPLPRPCSGSASGPSTAVQAGSRSGRGERSPTSPVPSRSASDVRPLRLEVLFLLETAEVVKRLINRADDGAGDAARFVEVAEKLEVFEVFGRLGPSPRAVAMDGSGQVAVVRDQPCSPLGQGPVKGQCGGGGGVLGVDRLAHVVQQGGQEELLVIGPRHARQLEDLEAVIERVPLGVALRVLLDRLERLEPHLVDREPVEVVGQRFGPGLIRGLGQIGRQERGARPRMGEDEELLADLGVGRQVAGPDAVAQHGRRLPLGGVVVALGCLVQPAQALRLAAGDRVEHPPGGLEGDLVAVPSVRGGHFVAFAKSVVHLTVFAYHVRQGQERAPVDELGQEVGLGRAVDRVNRIDDHGHRRTPVQEAADRRLDAVVGRNPVDNEGRMHAPIKADQAVGVGMAEDVERALLDRQVMGKAAEVERVGRQHLSPGPCRRRDPLLAGSAGDAVGRKPAELGVVGHVRTRRGDDGNALRPGIGRQSHQVRQDGLRPGDEERPPRLEEIALGVNIEEDQGTVEHGKEPLAAFIRDRPSCDTRRPAPGRRRSSTRRPQTIRSLRGGRRRGSRRQTQ